MNDRGRFLFGLCRMSVTMPLNSLINQCVLSQIELFDVTQMDEDVYFYCALDQKKKLMKLFPDVKDHGTTGVLGFVLLLICRHSQKKSLTLLLGLTSP